MDLKTFNTLSEKLLFNVFYEPGGFSFFPSTFFWEKIDIDLNSLYKNHFLSKNENNLYIHIPFCEKICSYCNCFKSISLWEEKINIYLNYLQKEAEILYKFNNFEKIKINNIFIWWWTPNILNINQFVKLFEIINKYFLFDLWEFLIDCHPNYLNDEKILLFKKYKVSRVTLALQTIDDLTLSQNNRENYDLEKIKNLVKKLKSNQIRINIDLVIWLKWQTFSSIDKDLEFVLALWVDNVSDHYLMKSNNFKYDFPYNYLDLVKYFKKNLHKLPKKSENKIESDFSNNSVSMIWLWASSVSNIYQKIIYIKPNIPNYYKEIDKFKIPISKWFILNKNYEIIKYIFLNIFIWIDFKKANLIFWENIYKKFEKQFYFLQKNGIIKIENNNLTPLKNDFEVLKFLLIFFIDKFKFIKNIPDLKSYYFLEDWTLIDK